MDYPQEFSTQALARIEVERQRANRELELTKAEQPPTSWTTNRWDKHAFHAYILRVFLAFAREACELGNEGVWAVDRIRSETREFLRRFSIEAYYEQGHDRSGQKFRSMTNNWNGGLLQEVEQLFQKSREWQEFQMELSAVAEQQAAKNPAIATSLQASAEGAAITNTTVDLIGPQPAVSPSEKPTPDPPLSERDVRVHDVVGEDRFEALTNADILGDRNLKKKLRNDFNLKTPDAVKACFDRIRKRKGYLLSREIKIKRSGR